MLLLDAGDFTHPNMKQEDRYNWFILSAMGEMGYDALTLGDLELYRGREYVERILDETKVPVTLANVTVAETGKRLGERYVVIERGGVRYGVIGLLGQDFGEGIEKFEGLGFKVDDPFVVAEQVVGELKSKVDIIVVLAHMGSADTFQLPKQVPGIDLLVFGHYPGTVAATQVDGAVTVRSGQRGQYVGETRLVINPEDEIVSYTGKAQQMTIADICEDTKMAEELAALKAEVDADQRKEQLNAELNANESKLVLGQDHFMGDLKCARCHFDVYKHWRDTAHATAWDALVTDHHEADNECVTCHVTGFREPGGFKGVGADQDMRNVQCEACHGMGTMHNMLEAATPLSETACTGCHDAENSPAFDFQTYWAEIAHPTAGD